MTEPWTPGPWTVRDKIVYAGDREVLLVGEDGDDEELRVAAAAPAMAELLEWFANIVAPAALMSAMAWETQKKALDILSHIRGEA